MKKMIKRATIALLILGFATSSTAQFGGGSQGQSFESTPWGCFNNSGYCNPC